MQDLSDIVGTTVMVTFLYVNFMNVIGSILPLSMDLVNCQVIVLIMSCQGLSRATQPSETFT